jgi:broad specificity phosphatase PhoE
LVRHGETTWNERGWVQGHRDAPSLTPRGRAQARRTGQLLSTENVGTVYSSDLLRARYTAEIIAEAIAEHLPGPVVTDRRLRERSFGTLEGTLSADLPPEAIGIVDGWVTDVDTSPAGGESLADVGFRCAHFLRWLQGQHHHRDVLVVAHGGTVRLLRAAVAGTEFAGTRWGAVENGSVQRLVLPPSDRPLTAIAFAHTHLAS